MFLWFIIFSYKAAKSSYKKLPQGFVLTLCYDMPYTLLILQGKFVILLPNYAQSGSSAVLSRHVCCWFELTRETRQQTHMENFYFFDLNYYLFIPTEKVFHTLRVKHPQNKQELKTAAVKAWQKNTREETSVWWCL